MIKGTQRPQAVLTEACYAALGAGDAAVMYVRKLSEQLPDQVRSARERLPEAFAQLAARGRRLTGQVAAPNGEATESTEPKAVTVGTQAAE
jgi:hypothetical protein